MGHGRRDSYERTPGSCSCLLQGLLGRLKQILYLLLSLFCQFLHVVLSFPHIVRPCDLLLLHILKTLVHNASGVTDCTSRLVCCRFCALDSLVPGFLCRRGNWDVELEVVMGIWLGVQG